MFQLKKNSRTVNPFGATIQALQEKVKATNYVTRENTMSMLSLESLDQSSVSSLQDVGQRMDSLVQTIVQQMGMDPREVTPAMEQAAIYSAMLTGDIHAVRDQTLNFNDRSVATENYSVIAGPAGGFSNRTIAQEAFNDVDNRTALSYSVMFNFLVARQNEVTETWWPPIVISPDQVGLEVHVNILNVFSGHKHKATGSWEDWTRRNLARAIADPTILNKHLTDVIPVFRPGSEGEFVDAAVVTPFIETADEAAITTSFLRTNRKVDIIGLAQTDALLATGESDQRDGLDPAVLLRSILVKIGTNDLLKFNTSTLRYNAFGAAPQNDRYRQQLSFSTTDLLIRPETLRVDGTALTDLAAVKTNNLLVRLSVEMAGHVNIETAELHVFSGSVNVHSVTDAADNTLLSKTDPRYLAIAAAVANSSVLGYQVRAYRSNANRRQRGQLINVQRFTQLYQAPWRTPIAVERPAHKGAEEDASDLQALLAATRTRIDNEAVGAIIETMNTMREYVDARDQQGQGPQLSGLGGYYVLPTYIEQEIDLSLIVDSIKSSERGEDIQAALVVKLRDAAARLYTYSEWKAASDVLFGGTAKPPKVILLTDPIIGRYLLTPGDLRTLGNDFELKVVQSLDHRVAGKIFMAFSTDDAGTSNEVNIMNFGNLVISPELVLAANMTRTGGYNKETQVQPRYVFINHCPVGAQFTVTGIPEVIRKVPVHTGVVDATGKVIGLEVTPPAPPVGP